jgi:flagellar hook protein FlgE
VASGAALDPLGTPGEDGYGTINSGYLEMSNVDLTEEFTNMIVTQRGYQDNARTITTSDEMLQELLNIKR